MKLVELNRNPSHRQLRQFGLVALVVLPLLGWLWSAGTVATVLLAAAGVLLGGLGIFHPRRLRPVFLGLSLLTLPIGLLVSELALLLLFYGVFFPIGLLGRLAGRDPLQRKRDPNAISYWTPRKQPADAASYFRRW